MNVLVKIAAVAAAVALSSQPCLAAAVESHNASAVTSIAATGAAGVQFDSERPKTARVASASLSLAASQQTASEAEDQPKRRGPGTTTWLVIGGVALLVLVVVAVASASPGPGPSEGAFD